MEHEYIPRTVVGPSLDHNADDHRDDEDATTILSASVYAVNIETSPPQPPPPPTTTTTTTTTMDHELPTTTNHVLSSTLEQAPQREEGEVPSSPNMGRHTIKISGYCRNISAMLGKALSTPKVQVAMFVTLALATISVVVSYLVVSVSNNNNNNHRHHSSSPMDPISSNNNNDDRTNNAAATDDVSSSSSSWSSTWDVSTRAVEIPQRLIQLGLATPSTFLDATSPRAQAMDWLVYQDTTLIGLDDPLFLSRYALMVLAYSTAVELWKTTQPWTELMYIPLCDWEDVQCNNNDEDNDSSPSSTTRSIIVTELDLQSRNLYGTIPDELGLLTGLTALRLSLNRLEGTIPEVLYDQLPNLEILELYRNQLSSTISPNIAQWTNLRYLFLGYNSFTGSLPISSLQALTNMQSFQLMETALEGPIFDAILAWPQLAEILIGKAPLLLSTLPTEIGHLTNLQHVILSDFTPYLPTELGLLTNLRHLTLSTNEKSNIPDDTNNNTAMTNSTHIASLPSTIPTEMSRLTNLRDLIIEGGITGTIPSTLGNLPYLDHLDFSFSGIHGTVPTEIGKLTTLTKLYLDNTNLSGTFPSELGSLAPLLDRLEVFATHITGTLPVEFCDADVMILINCPELTCPCCNLVWCI